MFAFLRSSVVLPLVGALVAAGAGAQTPPSELDRLIQEALSSNPDVASALARWEAAREVPERVGSLADPEFMTQVIRFRDRGVGIRSEGETWYMLRQEVPFPGKLRLRADVARRDADRAGKEYDAARLDLVEAVQLAYYELLHAKVLAEVALENRALVERTVQIARARYEVGLAPQQELLLARVEEARIANELAEYRRMGESAGALLNALLNRPVGSQYVLDREPDGLLPAGGPAAEERTFTGAGPASLDVDSLSARALRQRPELAEARLAASRDSLGLRLARKAYLPDFLFGLEYWVGQGMNPSPVPDERYVLDVGLTVPWLWRGKHEAAIREAGAQVRASRYAFDEAVNRVLREVETAAAEVRSAADQVRNFRDTILPEAGLNLRSAVEGYQTGEIGFLALLDTQRSLNELRIRYHTARIDLLKASARLTRATGASPPGEALAAINPYRRRGGTFSPQEVGFDERQP